MFTFFNRLFGKNSSAETPRDLASLCSNLRAPALHVLKSAAPSLSHFGGFPGLPSDTPWPEHEGRKLDILAKLSLPELQSALDIPWLPASGTLLFFYDLELLSSGYEPQHRDAWRVLHVPELPASPARQYDAEASLPARNILFRHIDTLPSLDRYETGFLDLSRKETDLYCDLQAQPFGEQPNHQIGGFPLPIQNDDMEMACQLASHGVDIGNPSSYHSPRIEALAPGAAHWRLLFQFDTDEDLDTMWGDCGMLYFWVEEDKARRGDFSDVWLVLQCY